MPRPRKRGGTKGTSVPRSTPGPAPGWPSVIPGPARAQEIRRAAGRRRGGRKDPSPTAPRAWPTAGRGGRLQPHGSPAPVPGSATDPRRAVTAARLTREAQERGLSCPPPFWSPTSSGLAACKIRAEEPTDPTGGTAAPRRRGNRVQGGHPMEVDGMSIRGG
ncbi:hypothetical protein NDU88_002059 [Pleurodeles waltl]|uniref:Uncharacterized protein n=1 Tax=Pleurodeles waltl TaxID=8319 RepID=A0AAV7Q4V8_PLEWA|nr:hypothetical protein NDU88_002059 [Pleurodeles waltl]